MAMNLMAKEFEANGRELRLMAMARSCGLW
jgi:hypothetical protein